MPESVPVSTSLLERAAHPVKFGAPADMSKLFESDAQRYVRNLAEATGYHHRAKLFASQGMRASLIFNVASIAIECYLIALCAHFRTMPMNHSFGSLMEDAERLTGFPDGLAEGIRSLDEIFGICSLEDYYHGTPDEADAERSLEYCAGLQALLGTLTENGHLPVTEGV
jgi:hypothetical protein